MRTDLDVGVAEFGFTYAIGNVLRVKVGGAQDRYYGTNPVRYVVVEQLLQICHGGIQRSLYCRVVVPGGGVQEQLAFFREFELEPADPFPDESKQDKIKKSPPMGPDTMANDPD